MFCLQMIIMIIRFFISFDNHLTFVCNIQNCIIIASIFSVSAPTMLNENDDKEAF